MPSRSADPAVGAPPRGLVEKLTGRPGEPDVSGEDWLATLPRLVAAALDRWDLTPDVAPGEPAWHGYCAYVLPVRRNDERLVLKLSWPHDEARVEHLALRAWAGRGAVHLVAAYPADLALLLERLDHTRTLNDVDVETSSEVIGGLVRRLDAPPFPQLPRLSAWTRRFLDETADVRGLGALPRRFVEQARSQARTLLDEPGIDARLVHADLHGGNVLAAARTPWLAIDPAALAGVPEFAFAPALWNRWGDAVASGDPSWHLKCRLADLAKAAGADEDRARVWTLIRLVDHAVRRARSRDPEGGPSPMTAVVAAMKAMASDR